MRDTREPGMQLKRKNPARAGKILENIYMKAAIPAFLSKSFMTKKRPQVNKKIRQLLFIVVSGISLFYSWEKGYLFR